MVILNQILDIIKLIYNNQCLERRVILVPHSDSPPVQIDTDVLPLGLVNLFEKFSEKFVPFIYLNSDYDDSYIDFFQ